jgi:hypothetical protein
MINHNSNLVGVIVRARHGAHVGHLKIKTKKSSLRETIKFLLFLLPSNINRKFKLFQEQALGIHLWAAPAAPDPAPDAPACSQNRTEKPAQETRHNQHIMLTCQSEGVSL